MKTTSRQPLNFFSAARLGVLSCSTTQTLSAAFAPSLGIKPGEGVSAYKGDV